MMLDTDTVHLDMPMFVYKNLNQIRHSTTLIKYNYIAVTV